MKIYFDVKNQIITRTDRNQVIANSADYLEAEITFSAEWATMEKTMTFKNGNLLYTYVLVNDKILEENHLNLGVGTWKVSIQGVNEDKKIVTNECNLAVNASGWIGSEALPPESIWNQLLVIIQSLHTEVASTAALRSAVQKYIEDNYDALVKEAVIVDDVRAALDDMAEDGTLSDLLAPLVAAGMPEVVADQISAVVAAQIGGVVANQIGAVVASQITTPVNQAVKNYCDDNFSGWSGALDRGLAQPLMAAPADMVGEIKSALTDLPQMFFVPSSWTENKFIGTDGTVNSFNGAYYSEMLCCPSEQTINFKGWSNNANVACIAFYRIDGTFISGVANAGANNQAHETTSPSGTAFAVLSTLDTTTAYFKYSKSMFPSIIKDIYNNNNAFETFKSTVENETRLCERGNYIKSFVNGYVNPENGKVISTGSGHHSTNLMEIPNGVTTLYLTNVYTAWSAWYDENGDFLSETLSFTVLRSWNGDYLYSTNVPNGAKYFRTSVASSQWSNKDFTWCWNKAYTPKNYDIYTFKAEKQDYAKYPVENLLEYDGKEFCVFNKCACIGDSITEGVFNDSPNHAVVYPSGAVKYSYPTQLEKMSGVSCSNFGVGGYTSVQWDSSATFDLSGHDVAIINLGINDVIMQVQTSASETALLSIINKLKTANTNIKIFIATIIPAYADGSSHSSGKYEIFNDMVREIASDTSDVYLIDLAKYSKTHVNSPYAQGHLTAIGYRQLAEEYMNGIGYVINQNLSDFKDVQFIGTDFIYTP